MPANEKELRIKVSGRVDNSLNAIGNKVDRTLGKVSKAAKAAGTVTAAAAAAAVSGAVTVGSSFESQMSTVQSISGSTADDMRLLTEKAQYMGATTKFTATEAGQALEYMAMAGWKTKDMLNGIEGIMNLAAASGEDLAMTSDIVTDALTAFGLTAKSSGHFADILAAASSNSNTNVAMMGETFKYVGSVAGALGYSAEDAAVSIGLMANSGIKSSQAGTSLRKIMTETAGSFTLVSKAGGKVRVNTANADGSMKDWSETVSVLRTEFGKMTEKEKAANAENIAGKTAMAGLLAIVNAGEKDYQKLTKSINNAKGAAKEMSDVRQDNLLGDVDKFKSALEGKGIELYDEIKEPMREFVQDATELLSEVDVGAVVDQVEEFGEAVSQLAEPLFSVGEWIADNQNVIGGAIAGLGSALVTYKVASEVQNLSSSIKTLGAAFMANPVVGGAALAVGAIAAVGTAVKIANDRAASADLDAHFGSIALSMDQIEYAAAEIVGSKKLESVGELLNNIEISDGLLKDLKTAEDNLKKLGWKLSVGLELSDEDMSSYQENVKSYINTTNELIQQEGYTVQVATEILFGDSSTGKELMKDNNAFYAGLDKETSELSKKINKKLERAMEDGLDVDLKEELDKLLSQMSEITRAFSEADAEASWQVMATDWSGKELTADSYAELQEEINKNVGEIEKGARESYLKELNTYSAQKKLGHIDDKEYRKRAAKAEKAYQSTKAEAKEKGAEFAYNTFMDTYAADIRDGSVYTEKGTKEGALELLGLVGNSVAGTSYAVDVTQLKNAINSGFQSDFQFFGFDPVNDPSLTKDKEYWKKKAYDQADSYKKEERLDALEDEPGVMGSLSKWGGEAISSSPDKFESTFKSLVKGAKEASVSASDEVKSTLKKQMESGVDVNAPIRIFGTYSVTGQTGAKKGADSSAPSVGPVQLPGHAKGTISRKEHLAWVSEGNKAEAIIPLDGSARSKSLYETAGTLMGYSSGGGSAGTFAPKITVYANGGGGGPNGIDAEKLSSLIEKKVEGLYRKMERDRMRFQMRKS